MPRITCQCGKTFDAARANAKYCSDRCRKRTKRSGADVVAIQPEQARPKPDLGPVTAAAWLELDTAGRLATSLGQQALRLAMKLDNGLMETGSAYASLSKEFREVMSLATKGAGAATAPQQLSDELAARRAKHRA